ncbi:flavonoid 3-hydroxylase [Phlyctema vagabunda]|uniref:Flavonoid 3-hydroxylase n=1 Tax=Phlyctema vagabunda TaxID=108571 RepID=A0ABR4P5H5_9HELO
MGNKAEPELLIFRFLSLITISNSFIILASYFLYKIGRQIIYYRFIHPLKDFPGPFWASVTRIWIAWHNFNETEVETEWRLSKKHGNAVRITPTLLLVSTAESIPLIYHRTANKTKHYIAGSFGATESVFNMQSHASHASHRKLVAAPYSFSKISKTEPLIDKQIDAWVKQLDNAFAETGKPFNFASWAVYVAFDIISEVGFGKALGFIEKGEDVGGLIAAFHDGLPAFGMMARLYPFTGWVKRTWMGKYLVASPEQDSGFGVLMRWRDKLVDERIRENEEGTFEGKKRVDLLQAFLDARTPAGEPLDTNYLRAEILLVLLAGSDTTGTAFGAILTFVLSSPPTYKRMLEEIDAATSSGYLSSPIPKYSEVAEYCPFYVACVKESMRLCPSAPNIFPRIPVGTEVTCNPWIVHRDPAIYGSDAEEFRPERWLEGDNGRLFDKYNMSFGYGSRACLGKDIAMMELLKTPLMFFRTFKPTLCSPSRETPGPPKLLVKGGIGYWKDIWLTIERRKV